MEKYKLISFVLSVFCAYLLYTLLVQQEPIIANRYIIKKDTIVTYQKHIVTIDRVVPKIIYKHDTIIASKPFVAEIDTVIKKDTIWLKYEFPENLFSMQYFPSKDSIRIEKIYEYKESKQKWYERIVYFVAGFGLSYLITK
ncbi:MAG TPA: hypothetical protein PLE30_09455 [Candidatus Kapabacteria bacterium]|nr:hypothetical protein [Candidatus Kapabacteria bacterium]